LLLVVSGVSVSQEVKREWVDGKISVPEGEDLENISLYNISSNEGAVTDENGFFKMAVAENDRIRVAAIQYQSFILIVSKADIEKKKLLIYLNLNVNRLDDVFISNVDLTGYLEEDVNHIPVFVFIPKVNLSYEALENSYAFEPDAYTIVDGIISEDALGLNNIPGIGVNAGVNLLGLLGVIVSPFVPKNKKEKSVPLHTISLPNDFKVRQIQEKYEAVFINETLGIPSSKTVDFAYFAVENGLKQNWLNEENEVQLLEYLYAQSEIYKKQIVVQN